MSIFKSVDKIAVPALCECIMACQMGESLIQFRFIKLKRLTQRVVIVVEEEGNLWRQTAENNEPVKEHDTLLN